MTSNDHTDRGSIEVPTTEHSSSEATTVVNCVTPEEMAHVLELARAAGRDAVAEFEREQGDRSSPWCGYGLVVVRPGTSRFARWLKAEGIATSNTHGGRRSRGVRFRASWGQNYERSSVYAHALADTLRSHGIDAWDQSDMD